MGCYAPLNQGSRSKTISRDLQTIFNFFRMNSEFQKKRKEVLISYLNSKKKTPSLNNMKNGVTNFVNYMKGKN